MSRLTKDKKTDFTETKRQPSVFKVRCQLDAGRRAYDLEEASADTCKVAGSFGSGCRTTPYPIRGNGLML